MLFDVFKKVSQTRKQSLSKVTKFNLQLIHAVKNWDGWRISFSEFRALNTDFFSGGGGPIKIWLRYQKFLPV